MAAFNRNGLQYVRLETGGKKDVIVQKFITDPSISTFFLVRVLSPPRHIHIIKCSLTNLFQTQHTRSQSAGLNLVVAKYVFLVEPLLIPGLELQAAGRWVHFERNFSKIKKLTLILSLSLQSCRRIHRMGQTQETTVFQYYIKDTVDARVAELRAVSFVLLPFSALPTLIPCFLDPATTIIFVPEDDTGIYHQTGFQNERSRSN